MAKPELSTPNSRSVAVSEGIKVVAEAETLDRTNAEVGGVIESPQIKEIPVSGRNWASLMLLAPGAINYGDGAQRAIRFSGHSLDDSNFTFDGVDASGVQEQTQKADARLNIALDAIAAVPRQHVGLHGRERSRRRRADQRRIQGRDERFPREPLLRAAQRCAGFPIALRRANSASFFSASVRRQYRRAHPKDKAFFYTNYEGLRQSLGVTFQNSVPNAAFRSQVLAKSPVLKPILDAYPPGRRRLTASPIR